MSENNNAEKTNNRKKIAITCVALSILCFIVYYVLKNVACHPVAELTTCVDGVCNAPQKWMTYEFCVEGTAANYWFETFLVQVGNAGLVFTLLWYFGWPALQGMVADRKDKIERDVRESGRQRDEAEKDYNEVLKLSANLSEEKATIRRSYEASAQAESAQIVEEAKLQAERMQADANASFELQANMAKRNFEHEVVAQAIDKARDEISNRLASDPALRDKLIDQGIAALEI